jgi:protein-S-isoprenylcysteine O-methyltransferase Ste14
MRGGTNIELADKISSAGSIAQGKSAMSPVLAFSVIWIAWLVSWLGAALWASRAAKRPPMRDEFIYRSLTVLGALLIFWRFGRGDELGRLWTVPSVLGWLLFAAAAAGLAFTWWARLHLGTLWSGNVTRKADHRIIDTGPYGLVRHPIYTGLMAALYATALDDGTVFALIGALVLTVAFYIKARLEERFLSEELGMESYGQYKRRVPMLLPFWPVRGS